MSVLKYSDTLGEHTITVSEEDAPEIMGEIFQNKKIKNIKDQETGEMFFNPFFPACHKCGNLFDGMIGKEDTCTECGKSI